MVTKVLVSVVVCAALLFSAMPAAASASDPCVEGYWRLTSFAENNGPTTDYVQMGIPIYYTIDSTTLSSEWAGICHQVESYTTSGSTWSSVILSTTCDVLGNDPAGTHYGGTYSLSGDTITWTNDKGTATMVRISGGCSPSGGMPAPAGQQFFTPFSVETPVVSSDPSQAMPIGIGPAASGGSTLSLSINTGQFSTPMDLYFAIYIPQVSSSIYLITSDWNIQPLEWGLVPWMPQSQGVNMDLLQNVGLYPGQYFFLLLATPPGDLSTYYIWETGFEVH